MKYQVKLSKAEGKAFNDKYLTRNPSDIKPHSRGHDYGEPAFRGCEFPDGANYASKRGKANPHPHSLWKFKSKAVKPSA